MVSSKKILSQEKNMARPHYDLAIIGGGSGGLTAARVAKELGAKVVLIDKERIGGDCLNYGCVPSKSLIHVARVVHQTREAMSLGLRPASSGVDMAKVAAYVQGVIERVSKTEENYVEGVTVKFGQVAFQSPTTFRVNDEIITSRTILIATGSHPALPEIAGLQATGYLTNEDVFNLTQLPASIAIIGGGPIGVELGQALGRLGARITIIQRAERILPREDPEVSTTIAQTLQEEGITIITRACPVKIERKGYKKSMTIQQDDRVVNVEADEILLATGRRPNSQGLNLEGGGVSYSEKGIQVNAYLQTSAPHIFAIGDVIGGYLFTHVAAYQASIAVRNALLPMSKKKVDYRAVPWCTFSDPEAAHVGLTPQEAQRHYRQTRVVKLPCSSIDRAQIEQATMGFIKLVLTGKKDEIVGAHIVAERAGEMLGEIALAIRHHLTINDIFNTMHAYPTMNTGLQQAAFEAYLGSAQATANRRIIRAVLKLRSKK
jgi:pyruvate/2-oxoglutarate dehydrogenase complex dihydrolipoamide dehydrogenase (E3) component